FGSVKQGLSENHEAIITNLDTTYSENAIILTVTALDKGHYTKKKTDNKIRQNKTTSQIAKEMAAKYNFATDITQTKNIYADLALKELNFIFFIRNNTLFFTERGLASPSKLTLTYGSSNLLSFKPIQKDSRSSGVGDETSTEVYDDSTKSNEAVDVTNANEEKTVTTTNVFIDSNKGELLKGNKKLTFKSDDKEEAKNVSNNIKKKDVLGTFEAELIME